MSEHSEPHESLHLTVVQESAKNYHSFLHKRKDLTEKKSIISKLKLSRVHVQRTLQDSTKTTELIQ